ncbi:hypothetical protein MMPV_003933 [Pyropia vietnamensis]
MVTLAATAARTATAATATATAPPATRRIFPTLTALSVVPPGRQPFGAPLDATLRVTTHTETAVHVAAAASFEVDIACGFGDVCGGGVAAAAAPATGVGSATASPLAATALAPLAGDGVVHELALPLGGALAALQRRVSADALCNVGLLRLALVVRGDGGGGDGGTASPPSPSAAATADTGEGRAGAAAACAGGGGGGGGDSLSTAVTTAAVAAVHEACPPPGAAAVDRAAVVVAERSMVVEVFRDQREGRVGGDDHDLLFRRIFVEE